ncbi:MAG TPA: hypothetical protein DCS97_00230 [Planctomycetes bacterium]|nr:hypothetical protein [Planctomycetota bacterium]
MPSRPQTPFGDYLDDLLRQRGLSVRAFGTLVGLGVSSVSAAKRRAIDPKRIEPWADALALKGQERARFVRLAWLTRTPPVIVALIERLERQLARSQARR